MAEPNGEAGTPQATEAPPGRDAPPRTPRWVKVAVGIALVLAILVAVMLLTGGAGEHGPGRHMGS